MSGARLLFISLVFAAVTGTAATHAALAALAALAAVAGDDRDASAVQTKAEISAVASRKLVEVKVTANAETKLNFDGPWKLEFIGALPLIASVAESKDFDRLSSSFKLPLKMDASRSMESRYKLTYFVCAKDKSWCKREVSEGEVIVQ